MSMHDVNFECIADAYVDYNNPNTNYGSASTLQCNNSRGGVNDNKPYKRAYLRFNIPNYLKFKHLINVLLHVYCTNDVSHYVNIRAFDSSWDENTITYNNSALISNYDILNPQVVLWVSTWSNIQLSLDIFKSRFDSIRDNGIEIIGDITQSSSRYSQIASRENTSYAPYVQVIYEDVPPLKPNITGPIGSYEDKVAVTRLSWSYNSEFDDTQKGFTLQWSSDQETWHDVSQTTPNNYYDMPADTFPTGIIYWRVKTKNQFDEESEYSDIASFYATGEPDAPVIQSVSASGRPTITWTTPNQQSFQVVIEQAGTILYDSGEIPGITTRSLKVPVFLTNGIYVAKVRISNEFDLFSDYAESEFTLDLDYPDQPIILLESTGYGIKITADNINEVDHVYIYRSISDADNYICIGKVTDGVFIDYSAASGQNYDYFARAIIDLDEVFTDSAVKTGRLNIRYNLLANISDLSNIIELKDNIDNIPEKSISKSVIGSPVFYAGRKRPIMEMSEHIESGINLSFFIADMADVQSLDSMVNSGETVLFRDSRGRKIYGVISSFNPADVRHGTMVTLIINEVDYSEEVNI